MTKTDGEYELVLGNRQLLSAFFIVVVLFGVFFAMGYVVGRNSGPGPSASSATSTAANSQRPEAAGPAIPQAPPANSPAQERDPAPKETKAVSRPEKTEPRREPATPPAKSSPARVPPATPQAPAGKPSGGSAVASVTPGPGRMYLQVAAVGQPQADVVADTLRQKGFPALLAAGPTPALLRVMVGPFADASMLGKAKADLENAGFHPIVRK